MIARQGRRLAQIGLAVLALAVLLLAAHGLSRHNALVSFTNYRPDWDDAWRAPVENLAMEVLRREIPHPEQDLELTQAAMFVLRRSPSWVAMAPGICSQLKGWMDVRLDQSGGDADRLKETYDLMVMAQCEDSEVYKTRIAALAGDRSALAQTLSKQAQILTARMAAGTPIDAKTLDALSDAWNALRSPLGGKPINWLALDVPVVAAAQRDATLAVLAHLHLCLEPYMGKITTGFADTMPDENRVAWLDHQADLVNQVDPGQQDRVRSARGILAQFAPKYPFEPLSDAACTAALRYRHVTWSGLIIGLLVSGVLVTGLWFSLVRMARGPKPVDVDAETMENVEPIDLDTDAETRSRTSASITDGG